MDEFVWLLCTDNVKSRPNSHLPNGDSLYLPSNRPSVPAHELARVYCGISGNHRKRYNEFMEKFIDAYGGSGDWPTRVEESGVPIWLFTVECGALLRQWVHAARRARW